MIISPIDDKVNTFTILFCDFLRFFTEKSSAISRFHDVSTCIIGVRSAKSN